MDKKEALRRKLERRYGSPVGMGIRIGGILSDWPELLHTSEFSGSQLIEGSSLKTTTGTISIPSVVARDARFIGQIHDGYLFETIEQTRQSPKPAPGSFVPGEPDTPETDSPMVFRVVTGDK